MIKDVMVRLDGTSADDVRLAAANLIAQTFESHITGLFFNVLPSTVLDGAGVNQATRLLERAREAGDVIEADVIEATVFERLTRLQQPTNLRRFDVADDSDIADTALPLARAADTFVALRPTVNRTNPKA